MDPVPVQIRPFSPDRCKHLVHIRIIYKSRDHFPCICKPDGNTAVIIPEHKIRRTVDRIDQEAQTIEFFLPGIPFCLLLAEKCRLWNYAMQLIYQELLDRHIIRSNKIRIPFLVLYKI